MTELSIQSERARRVLEKLAGKIDNLKPVWKRFIDYWQADIMPKTWDSKGKVMGESWPPLTPKYKKWKRKHGNKRLMELSGFLFSAVTGGAGWKQKIKKKNLIIGVEGYKYFEHVQERKTNGRFYFNTRNEDLPNRAYAFLILDMDKHLEEADNE